MQTSQTEQNYRLERKNFNKTNLNSSKWVEEAQWKRQNGMQNWKMLIKFNCRSCTKTANRWLHPSKFLLPCKRCHFASHLTNIRTSHQLILGGYECQNMRCGLSWVQRLPFKNIILNTPICQECNRLTKISMMIYRQMKVNFKNSLLYKCSDCSKYKTLPISQNPKETFKNQNKSTESPSKVSSQEKASTNPQCNSCNIPMNLLKNLKSLYFTRLDSIRPNPANNKNNQWNDWNQDRSHDNPERRSHPTKKRIPPHLQLQSHDISPMEETKSIQESDLIKEPDVILLVN